MRTGNPIVIGVFTLKTIRRTRILVATGTGFEISERMDPIEILEASKPDRVTDT